ncbi:potassium channel family protein [Methanotorris formicicus]|uniref:TrkA-N domain protein n=1 Tax=Methanotorris formicicus Mc-S-70 TaxID=647171 RepID=H1KYC9_9EURY|nr:potassium channel protein [Methanotorris formicicus]EHP87213.1 TrkA-N domain protein [Methanotorris formicicus Mc-S-70]
MDTLKKIELGILAVLGIILIETFILMSFEGWNFFEAFYMAVVTISTVGYGDYTPKTFLGRLSIIFYIFAGVGAVAYIFGNIANFFIEGQFKEIFRRKKMHNKLKSLKDHFIICGFGKLGRFVAKKFRDAGVPFVVVDSDEEKIKEIFEKDQKLIYIVGDATSDDILLKAGIKRARGLISVVGNDAENVFITLSARRLNPNLYIVAKAENENTIDKLLKAGADGAISPYAIGGLRIVEMALKPEILDFVSSLMDVSHDIEIGRYVVGRNSKVVGKTLYESQIRQKTGATILAIKRANELHVNPSPDVVLEEECEIYAFGTKDQLEKLKEILEG